MLVALNVVQNKNQPVAGRQIVDRPLQRQPVNSAGKGQIRSAKAASRAVLPEPAPSPHPAKSAKPLLAQLHQHDIDGQPVQPGGKGRVAPERRNLPVQLKKCLLGQIFSLRNVAHHAQA